MEGRGGNDGEGDRSSAGSSEGDRNWRKVVKEGIAQDLGGGIGETSTLFYEDPQVSRERNGCLEEGMEGLAVITWSLARRVPLEWVAKEIKDKGKLDYDLESFFLAEDHHLLRFRAAALSGRPWFVTGQLLAMEP
ncbi:hypothetical protein COCNU_scaffold007514G000090 [Cocos nucifera]|nr:hypothetical protein [Cocos nucifera]